MLGGRNGYQHTSRTALDTRRNLEGDLGHGQKTWTPEAGEQGISNRLDDEGDGVPDGDEADDDSAFNGDDEEEDDDEGDEDNPELRRREERGGSRTTRGSESESVTAGSRQDRYVRTRGAQQLSWGSFSCRQHFGGSGLWRFRLPGLHSRVSVDPDLNRSKIRAVPRTPGP